jgi:hypothetical protein
MGTPADQGQASGSRKDSPIFVAHQLDDLGLTVDAFRVYGHLSRRAGKENYAYPSYASIGEYCFRSTYPKALSASLRRKAIKAVAELERAGIVAVQRRKGAAFNSNNSNSYRILPLASWNPKAIQVEEDGDVEEKTKPRVKRRSKTPAKVAK